MSKRYNIRWTENDRTDLKKSVRNFNDKIRRVERKIDKKLEDPTLSGEERKNLKDQKKNLPDRLKVSEVEVSIETRQDLKREIKSLKGFTKRGAEELVTLPDTDYNLKTTKWQKREMEKMARSINAKRKKRYEDISETEVTSRGEKQGYKKKDVGFTEKEKLELKPLSTTSPKMTQTGLRERFKTLKQEMKDKYWDNKDMMLKQNVINGIKANYNAPEFKSDVDAIIKAIQGMSFKEFWKRFNSESGEMEIVSPPIGGNNMDTLRANISALRVTWAPEVKPV